jgi:hypothetical protein
MANRGLINTVAAGVPENNNGAVHAAPERTETMKTDLIDITPATDNATTIAEHLAFDPLAEAQAREDGESWIDQYGCRWSAGK